MFRIPVAHKRILAHCVGHIVVSFCLHGAKFGLFDPSIAGLLPELHNGLRAVHHIAVGRQELGTGGVQCCHASAIALVKLRHPLRVGGLDGGTHIALCLGHTNTEKS
jgi:hypothetical protein